MDANGNPKDGGLATPHVALNLTCNGSSFEEWPGCQCCDAGVFRWDLPVFPLVICAIAMEVMSQFWTINVMIYLFKFFSIAIYVESPEGKSV